MVYIFRGLAQRHVDAKEITHHFQDMKLFKIYEQYIGIVRNCGENRTFTVDPLRMARRMNCGLVSNRIEQTVSHHENHVCGGWDRGLFKKSFRKAHAGDNPLQGRRAGARNNGMNRSSLDRKCAKVYTTVLGNVERYFDFVRTQTGRIGYTRAARKSH